MFVETRIISKRRPHEKQTGPYLGGGELRVQAPKIVAAPQSTTVSMPRAVHRGGERIYIISNSGCCQVQCFML